MWQIEVGENSLMGITYIVLYDDNTPFSIIKSNFHALQCHCRSFQGVTVLSCLHLKQLFQFYTLSSSYPSLEPVTVEPSNPSTSVDFI
jgi:hypothetical protein